MPVQKLIILKEHTYENNFDMDHMKYTQYQV